MNKLNNKEKVIELLSRHNPSFNDGFTDRVIDRINSEGSYIENTDTDFYSIFRWIAISGVAAIILLLFTVYLTDGTFSSDAIYGILNYSPDEPLLASLDY